MVFFSTWYFMRTTSIDVSTLFLDKNLGVFTLYRMYVVNVNYPQEKKCQKKNLWVQRYVHSYSRFFNYSISDTIVVEYIFDVTNCHFIIIRKVKLLKLYNKHQKMFYRLFNDQI